jgi:putative ABC transport system substrate-binding protein
VQKCIVKWIILVVFLLNNGMFTSDARAAERGSPFLIGALTESWGVTPNEIGLRDGLVALGYRENEHFVIGSRFTQGNITTLPDAARDLVQYGAQLIFAATSRAAEAAQKVAPQLPIVFAGAVDPVKLGLIESFARPGNNITGVAELTIELGPKRLEIFRQLIPELKRILFPYNATDAFAIAEVKAYREAARSLGLELIEQAVTTQEEARRIITVIRKGEVDGIIAPRCCGLNISGFILEASAQQGIPTLFPQAFWVERGALASYGPDLYDTGKQAARLVDKIIKGANPADLPVEVNSKIEFVINRKVAQAMGLAIAPEVLFRADRLVR